MLLEKENITSSPKDIVYRPRRNRRSVSLRGLVQETRLHPSDFVVPLFIIEGSDVVEAVNAMPGVYRYSIDQIIREVEGLVKSGICAVDLFSVVPIEKKDDNASEAVRPNNLLYRTVSALKQEFPELCVMVDVALDPFTIHGHDGIVDASGRILNDETIDILMQMSVLAAEAGADVIAPSDMMDGRVSYIRRALDRGGFCDVGICSYAAKYASSFYGPFRDALHSAPKFGDKKTYQMNPANRREALMESSFDEAEGADMLLIKPALAYLDVIAAVKNQCDIPVGAYHVSGEYSMVMAAAERGWIDADKVFMESLLSIKRAGADFIFTYAAKHVLPYI
ncbi:MAG: porphobilinogen synthase [Chlamydiota bacterium]|nr:porphobilinogen synthase [Chlamydiota bacterium]